jgi:murein L,D-transpeptidase YcbB/YkuD
LEKPPVYRQYVLLKNQLKKYQNIKKAGGFPLIAAVKKSLKKGDSALIIIDIKKWLAISEDLPVNSNNNIYDENLEIAVKKFQKRFGLADDGSIGAGSIKQMNIPIETRIQQIMVNMERSRWLPVTVSSDYLVVNIPEFKLHAYEKDKLLWSMDAVVGRPLHKTVIFSGKIKYIVFSPYWNVPSSILNREILPNIRRDKNYLESQNMEWHNGRVRQKSGPSNSLGLVKFLFPNNFEIYLHDTPSKHLFNKNNRAFSHGCVRLSDAEKLANYLLKNDTTWTPKKIKTAMHLGKEKYVTLKKDETVFIVYFTSWVDESGQLNFRKDLYKRDKQLAAILLNYNGL